MSPPAGATLPARQTLTRPQIRGFWAAWSGWVLDGMDSFIFALVLVPALRELLPKSGIEPTSAHVGFAGSVLFAVFLCGWGTSMVWGPIADRFGRSRTLAASIACYALFTAAAALSQNVWQLGAFRFLAGVGIGGEWALAGTFVAELWPESARKQGAGYLGTGYYVGFFLAAALNYSVGAHFGWRAMFLCGGAPVLLALYMASTIDDTAAWKAAARPHKPSAPLAQLFSPRYRRRTLLNAALVTVSIIGLWAAVVYEPAAIVELARRAGMSLAQGSTLTSLGTALLAVGTCLGCLALPPLAERFGRRGAQGIYFFGMGCCICFSFGYAYYVSAGPWLFIGSLFFLGLCGGNFAMYNLWLPEQYPTAMRATAFAFVTSFGRYLGAGANFLIGAAIHHYGSIGLPIACTAFAFVLGIALLPGCVETRGEPLPP